MHELLFFKIENMEDPKEKIVFNEPTKIFCMNSAFKDQYTEEEESAVVVAEVPFMTKHT